MSSNSDTPNTDNQTLERRLAAVERAVSGSEREVPDETTADRESLEHRLETLESRVDELDAALQAVRGFLGGIDAVNEAVEARADAAIAAVDRLERRLDVASEKSNHPELPDRPDAGANAVVDEWSGDGGDGTASHGYDESGPETEDSDTDNESVAGETADDADRTLRDRLSEQW